MKSQITTEVIGVKLWLEKTEAELLLSFISLNMTDTSAHVVRAVHDALDDARRRSTA